MINITYDFTIDEIISKYKKDLMAIGQNDMSQFVYYSTNKKDIEKDGSIRCFFVDLDNKVRELIKENNLQNGFVLASSKHTTSSCYINHFETGIMYDMLEFLRELYPVQKKYKHNDWDFEYKNADAHLKSMHLGKNIMAIVKDGELILGDFENIIYAEFDARPGKSITISLFGE